MTSAHATASQAVSGVKAARAHALVIGLLLDQNLKTFFSRSHWSIELAHDVNDAAARFSKHPVQAVLCDARDWRAVSAAAVNALRPPIVFALADRPDDKEWLEANEKGVWYVDTRKLNAPHLFSLLNHAWRVWNLEM